MGVFFQVLHNLGLSVEMINPGILAFTGLFCVTEGAVNHLLQLSLFHDVCSGIDEVLPLLYLLKIRSLIPSDTL